MKTLVILLVVLFAGSALASGEGHQHHHDGGHMAAMRAVRDQVPAEYRVMDRSPVTPTAESLARGAALFAQNCAVCHGATGHGDGPAAAAMAVRPANFHDAHHSGFYAPGVKFWIISHGLESGMPSFGERLTPLQRWDLVNHVINLPRKETDDLFN